MNARNQWLQSLSCSLSCTVQTSTLIDPGGSVSKYFIFMLCRDNEAHVLYFDQRLASDALER